MKVLMQCGKILKQHWIPRRINEAPFVIPEDHGRDKGNSNYSTRTTSSKCKDETIVLEGNKVR